MHTRDAVSNYQKKKKRLQIAFLFYLVGIIIFSLPKCNEQKNRFQNKAEFQKWEETKKNLEKQEKQSKKRALKKEMEEYNKKIARNHQKDLKDPWAYEQAGISFKVYGIQNEMLGKIEIPKMDLELPLYAGATQEHMKNGAAILGQTSMPIGGENTNCVIAAHRGYQGIPFFRNIERLNLNDKVYIKNFWGTLQYQVTKIEVISPDEVDKIFIQKKKDMITLLTCHPYPSDTFRYVVFCRRVRETDNKLKIRKNNKIFEEEKRKAVMLDEKEIEKEKNLTKITVLLYVLIGSVLFFAFLRLKKNRDLKKEIV